jgi:hypothetical protein
MESMNVIMLLVGFILGMILTAVGYHKWFTEYNEVIDDLKQSKQDKDLVIHSLKEYVDKIEKLNEGQKI